MSSHILTRAAQEAQVFDALDRVPMKC